MSPDLMPLADILHAVMRAMEFVKGYDADRFRGDTKTQWAVYSQIIIVGEAARRVSVEFRERHPAIPWSDIVGMRNKLIHDYDEIDWDLVWETIAVDLPLLEAAIGKLIPMEP